MDAALGGGAGRSKLRSKPQSELGSRAGANWRGRGTDERKWPIEVGAYPLIFCSVTSQFLARSNRAYEDRWLWRQTKCKPVRFSRLQRLFSHCEYLALALQRCAARCPSEEVRHVQYSRFTSMANLANCTAPRRKPTSVRPFPPMRRHPERFDGSSAGLVGLRREVESKRWEM
ncbi:hypothetical protein PHSY_002908 [Pseudozyma hubeiensis SY62]|uniref:WRKY domain-containing protein n=1 Tax=Pseudozyma hubeiensis (strain SY62) TaxID=1305764 RepID=R9P1Z6_PSEHS|nr:hypothetical protein PHSY_002908 [Pseudozyma hubeiensis SY62]GAC95333.1 hypothetical protein PHSY_002908 [Pseudozyma hubeiensis SY62]